MPLQQPAAPAPQAATPLPAQSTTLQTPDALRTQINAANTQLAGLRAEWEGLQSQLNAMLRNNPARPGVQARWADVGMQMAQVQGKIATLQAQYAIQTGHTAVPPTPPPSRNAVNTNVLMSLAFVAILAMVLPRSIGAAIRAVRGAPTPSPRNDDVAPRLDRLETAVDAIAIEIERVSEGQRFMTKLMAERAQPQPAAATAANSDAPLALGAGPAEPVQVRYRDEVAVPRPESFSR